MSSGPTTINEFDFAPFRQQFVTIDGLRLCSYTNIPEASSSTDFSKKTILILLHGYPQSPHLWRYVAPKLAEAGYPLFIPDLPGYANSPDLSQSHPQDKLSTGTTLLKSLQEHLSKLSWSSESVADIILVSHDRGSRISHRLAVSKPLNERFRIKAVAIMDIVPTTEQFAGFGQVKIAKGYFHWPMLANVEIATQLITGMGGSKWVMWAVERMTQNEETHKAAKIYASHFDNEAVVTSSCRDYEAAALVDVPAQKEDQEAGRKVDIPILVFWSEAGLGSWFEIEKTWRQWIKEGTDAEFCPVGEGAGHYVAEDAPETVGNRLLQWLSKVDK